MLAAKVPAGFGFPLASNEPLLLFTQVLNLNIQHPQNLKVRHRVTIDYVRARDLTHADQAALQRRRLGDGDPRRQSAGTRAFDDVGAVDGQRNERGGARDDESEHELPRRLARAAGHEQLRRLHRSAGPQDDRPLDRAARQAGQSQRHHLVHESAVRHAAPLRGRPSASVREIAGDARHDHRQDGLRGEGGESGDRRRPHARRRVLQSRRRAAAARAQVLADQHLRQSDELRMPIRWPRSSSASTIRS